MPVWFSFKVNVGEVLEAILIMQNTGSLKPVFMVKHVNHGEDVRRMM